MIATKKSRKRLSKTDLRARPVTEVLLELAYYLNTSKVVARPTQIVDEPESVSVSDTDLGD